MIERYTTKEMGRIWSDENKFSTWLKVEIAVTEVLTSDKMSLTGGGTLLQFFDLGSNNSGAQLVATLKKTKPAAKKKIINRVNSVVVDKSSNGASGIGTTTANDGLTYGNYPYGTRVQDEEISLNVPDAIIIHAVYESASTSDPSAPTLTIKRPLDFFIIFVHNLSDPAISSGWLSTAFLSFAILIILFICKFSGFAKTAIASVSYTHLRAHET